MTAAEFAQLLPKKPRRRGEWWDGICPGHDDRRASLSFKDGARRLIFKCRAGCTDDRIVKALGLELGALFHDNNGHRASSAISATYDYTDERGQLLYQVVRLEPKDFRLRRPGGSGGWTWSVSGVRRVVYRLHELAEAHTHLPRRGRKGRRSARQSRLAGHDEPGWR
jgi:putative DNA primase/helicase